MRELFPLFSGALIGALVLILRSQMARVVTFVLACILVGVMASWFSGELEESWVFFSVDMALVWFGGLAMITLLTAIRYRKQLGMKLAAKQTDKRS